MMPKLLTMVHGAVGEFDTLDVVALCRALSYLNPHAQRLRSGLWLPGMQMSYMCMLLYAVLIVCGLMILLHLGRLGRLRAMLLSFICDRSVMLP